LEFNGEEQFYENFAFFIVFYVNFSDIFFLFVSMQQPIPEYKVVTIGDSGVGKTCIINRFYYGSFNSLAAPTIGAAYVKSRVDVNGKPVYINIWDTAGQEKYSDLIPMYLRESNVVIICFDINEADSLQKVQHYRNVLSQSIPPEVPIIIAGNKIDLAEDQSKGRDVFSWAMSQGITAFSVSAKTGQGIEDLFNAVATEAHQKAVQVNRINKVIKERREREENPSSCC
jgi:small GTP-binding protein